LKWNVVLKKLDRIVAWILALLFLAMMISGYMSVKGFHRGRDGLIVLGTIIHALA
jgi:cytochrome b subunit of formate dehydrogenase